MLLHQLLWKFKKKIRNRKENIASGKQLLEKVQRRGIGVLCSVYMIGDRELISCNKTSYINIENFLTHVNVYLNSDSLELCENSYKNFKKYI
jgi:hypothetical protein